MNSTLLYPGETEALIRAVEKRPPLWDRFDKLYTHRPYVRKLWKDVAQEVNQSEHVLRKRWKGCKDTYRKKLKKVQNEEYMQSEETEKWQFFHLMGFLGNNINYKNQLLQDSINGDQFGTLEIPSSSEDQDLSCNEITTNVESACDSKNVHHYEATSSTNNILEPQCNVNEEDTQLQLSPHEPTNKGTKRKKKQSNSRNELLKIERRKLDLIQKLTSNERDDNYQFLMSLLGPMQRMNNTSNMWFRLRVQELLYSCATEQR